jgi:hypothetical protein
MRKPEGQAGPQSSTMDFIKKSSKADLGGSCILIYGVPNAGKTTLAVSASEMWPKEPSDELVHLSDVLVMQHDKGALDSLAKHGATCDYIDMSVCPDLASFAAQRQKVVKHLRSGDHDYKILVHDTISQMDTFLTAATDSMGLDGYDKYRRMLTEHRMYYSEFASIPNVVNIFVVHAQAVVDPDGKKKYQSLPGFSDVTPAVTGKAGGIYINQSSFVWPLVVDIKKTPKGTEVNRYILPHGGMGYQGRSKRGKLEEREVADMRVLLEKIKQ